MSSEAITRNDLMAILNEVLPPQVDASDYVIEQDTDRTWYWRKWKSGLAECWAKSTSNNVNWTIELPSWVTSIISVTTSSWVSGRIDTYDGYTAIIGARKFEHYSQTTGGASGGRGCHVYALCTWKTFESGSI